MRTILALVACMLTLPLASAHHGPAPPAPSWITDNCTPDGSPLCTYSCDNGPLTPLVNVVLACAGEAQADAGSAAAWAPGYTMWAAAMVVCHVVYDQTPVIC